MTTVDLGPESYVPFARFKRGEYEGHHRLDAPNKDRIVACVVLPSLKERDKEKHRLLTEEEVITTQTRRIAEHWGSRPLFVDLRYLKFAGGLAKDAQQFQDFLAEAALRRCRAVPVIDVTTSPERLAVVKQYASREKTGVTLRVAYGHLPLLRTGAALHERLAAVGQQTVETVLMLDMGSPAMLDARAFADFIAEQLTAAQKIGPWARVVVAATNYPGKNPAGPNGSATPVRLEWLAWRQLVTHHPWVLSLATFGDFGADNANIQFKAGGGVIQVHLRYALTDSWLICRGGPSNEVTDGTIRSVAKRIVNSAGFAGELFSDGDEEIARLAAGFGGPGGATEWRRINMNHHWTRTTVDIGDLVGNPIARVLARRRSVQPDMFGVLVR